MTFCGTAATVTIQWTGLLDWNTGLLDWNTGLLDWNTGLGTDVFLAFAHSLWLD